MQDVNKARPVFNVFHQNSLLNSNIMVAFNPEMAEEIISLVRECCSTDSGLENRDEYPHLYGLSDRLQSNLDYSRMQMLHRSSHRSPTDRIGIGSFLNNIESENECSTVG